MGKVQWEDMLRISKVTSPPVDKSTQKLLEIYPLITRLLWKSSFGLGILGMMKVFKSKLIVKYNLLIHGTIGICKK